MSVVIACATTTRAVIKCDGRAMNMNTGKILSENTNKLFRIGENCVIGVTGNLEYCVIVIEAFKRLLGEKDAMENIGLDGLDYIAILYIQRICCKLSQALFYHKNICLLLNFLHVSNLERCHFPIFLQLLA